MLRTVTQSNAKRFIMDRPTRRRPKPGNSQKTKNLPNPAIDATGSLKQNNLRVSHESPPGRFETNLCIKRSRKARKSSRKGRFASQARKVQARKSESRRHEAQVNWAHPKSHCRGRASNAPQSKRHPKSRRRYQCTARAKGAECFMPGVGRAGHSFVPQSSAGPPVRDFAATLCRDTLP